MLIQSNIVRGKTSRITKNILVSNFHFILLFPVLSDQSQRRILRPYHSSEWTKWTLNFISLHYVLFLSNNEWKCSVVEKRAFEKIHKNSMCFKSAILNSAIITPCIWLIQFKASVWLNHFVIIRLPLLIESRAIRLVHTWQLRQSLKIFWILNRKV